LPQLEQGTHVKISARNTTLDAVKSLNLKVGGRAYAVIKASSVMVAVD
jgi:molybdopterin-binding protein